MLYSCVARLIQTLKKEYDMALLYEVRDRELPMVEMCEGDYKEIVQILVTEDVDVADIFGMIGAWRIARLIICMQPKPRRNPSRGGEA